METTHTASFHVDTALDNRGRNGRSGGTYRASQEYVAEDLAQLLDTIQPGGTLTVTIRRDPDPGQNLSDEEPF